MNGGVVQGIERWITNPAAASSKLAPPHLVNENGCPVLLAPSNRNPVGPAKVEPDRTRQGDPNSTPSGISSQGCPHERAEDRKEACRYLRSHRGLFDTFHRPHDWRAQENYHETLGGSGTRCQQMMDVRMRGIRCEAVECDEIWTFVGKKEGVMKAEERKANPELGNQYTYIALDPISKVIPAFHVGKRDSINTHHFIEDLSRRIEGSTQVSTGTACYGRRGGRLSFFMSLKRYHLAHCPN